MHTVHQNPLWAEERGEVTRAQSWVATYHTVEDARKRAC
jgi:hypothetical protein